jgi:hypothetical protein
VTATSPQLFSEVSAVTVVGDSRFGARVDPEWTIGGKPNGGYLLAMLARAAERASPHEPFDPASLLFAVDAFPPATFDIKILGLGADARADGLCPRSARTGTAARAPARPSDGRAARG